MLFISLWNSFGSQDVKFFVLSPSPLFFPGNYCFRTWSKINAKVHDVINCLNKSIVTNCLKSCEERKAGH